MITYSIDAERKLVVTISSGVLNLEQIHAHLDRLKGDPAFRSDFNQLLDLRHVTHVDIDSHGLRVLAEVTAFAPSSKRAVVAGLAQTLRDLCLRMQQDFLNSSILVNVDYHVEAAGVAFRFLLAQLHYRRILLGQIFPNLCIVGFALTRVHIRLDSSSGAGVTLSSDLGQSLSLVTVPMLFTDTFN